MGYSFGLLPGRHDPSTQSYPIALPPLASNSHSGEAVGPTVLRRQSSLSDTR